MLKLCAPYVHKQCQKYQPNETYFHRMVEWLASFKKDKYAYIARTQWHNSMENINRNIMQNSNLYPLFINFLVSLQSVVEKIRIANRFQYHLLIIDVESLYLTYQIQLNSFKDFLLSLVNDDETRKKKKIWSVK